MKIRIRKFEKQLAEGDGGCWLWQGPQNKGYGKYGGSHLAHRVSYEYHVARECVHCEDIVSRAGGAA